MDKFHKCGIILENSIELTEGYNDRHFELLEELGIENNYRSQEKIFVEAELIPENDE